MSPLLSSSSFGPAIDVNWEAFSNPTFLFPASATNQSTFPPSPVLSPKDIIDEQITLAEFLRQAADNQIIDPALSLNNYPSPQSSASPHPCIEPPPTESKSPILKQIESPKSPIFQKIESTGPIIRRRGPGRPSKAQLAREKAEGTQSTKNVITMRRVIHNDSAMRSRARFNSVLDELWNEIPEKERMVDASKQLCRAEKIEIVISYVRKLQKRNYRTGIY
jgi:hypothetical protein